jgi:hypothetical protein
VSLSALIVVAAVSQGVLAVEGERGALERYACIVREYQRGEHERAVAEIGQWPQADVREVLDSLSRQLGARAEPLCQRPRRRCCTPTERWWRARRTTRERSVSTWAWPASSSTWRPRLPTARASGGVSTSPRPWPGNVAATRT